MLTICDKGGLKRAAGAMHLDVQDLRNFYYRSPLGRAAQQVIRGRLVQLWPETKGMTVVGFGFSLPLLRPFLGQARRVIGLMPAQQGVMAWPAGAGNVSVLCEEVLWPIETGSVDRLVLLHGLEMSDQPSALLEECWRVLGPGGKLVVIAPSRAGLWARRDGTPFGYGKPYSLGQLEGLLRLHEFVIERSVTTLYQPPFTKRIWRRMANLIEAIGEKMPLGAGGGVLMVEVSKQVAAARPKGVRKLEVKRLRILAPMPVQTPTQNQHLLREGRVDAAVQHKDSA